jgi:hypothetical protein
MSFKPRHKDCPSCKHFKVDRPSAKCLPCGAGEFFEERVDEDNGEPSDSFLMAIYAGMSDHDYET